MIKNRSGFTLVEIMIVVLIIALLASIAIPNLMRARITANDAAAQAALKAISTAMETYVTINSVYPTDTASLTNAVPPYLQVNYFIGTHNGFTFTVDSLANNVYSVTAAPATQNLGSASFTVTTGSVLTKN